MFKYIFLACLFWSTPLFSQVIKGRVTDGVSPLPGAHVMITETKELTISDSLGNFIITPPTAYGPYTLQISMLGFVAKLIEIEGDGKSRDLGIIALKEDVLQLNQVVVSASRNPIAAHRAPVMVNRVGSKLLDQTQSLSLAEGLHFTPGLRVENNCQNCGFTQVRLNGLQGAYTQILINSRPVFSALAGVYGLEMLPASMIDRVEVVRGGGSVLFGGNAIAGTVNILTKDPINNEFELHLNESFINGTSPDRSAGFNGSLVSKDLSKGLRFYAFNRNRRAWDANGDGFSEITQMNNQTLGADAYLQLAKRTKVKASLYRINEFRRGGSDFDLLPHQARVAEQLNHLIIGGNASIEHFSKDYKRKFSLYTSAQSVKRDSYYGAGGRVLLPTDSITNDDLLALNAYGNSDDLSLATGFQYAQEFGKNLSLVAGSEFQWNKVNDQMPGYQRQIQQQVAVWGQYAQLSYQLHSRLTIMGGLRYDLLQIRGDYRFNEQTFTNNQQPGILVPRFNLMYQANSKLKLRAGVAQGYRSVQAFDEDLHIETVGGAARFIQLAPNLNPEFSTSFTFSANYEKQLKYWQINVVLEAFRTDLDNAFVLSDPIELPNGVSVLTKRNGAGAIVQGLNLEWNAARGRKLTMSAGLTLQQAQYKETETLWTASDSSDARTEVSTNQLLRTPNAYGYYALNWIMTNKWTLSLSGVYTGKMKVAHMIDPETEYIALKRTPTFFEQNLKVAYELKNTKNYRIEAYTGINNMLNAYQRDFDQGPARDAGYVYGPMRPRTLFFGLKFNVK